LSINCVPSRALADDLRRLGALAPRSPLAAYGNLGPPADPEGLHFVDAIDPADYAALASDWLAIGARMIGGGCGATAAHTKALASLLGRSAVSSPKRSRTGES